MTQELMKQDGLDYLGRTLLAAVGLGVAQLGDAVAVNLSEEDAVAAELQSLKVDEYIGANVWLKGFVMRREIVTTASGQYEGLISTLALITGEGEPVMVSTISNSIATRLVRLSQAKRFGASPLPIRITATKNGGNTFYDIAPHVSDESAKKRK